MPLETEYSDDINFNNPCLETLQQLVYVNLYLVIQTQSNVKKVISYEITQLYHL